MVSYINRARDFDRNHLSGMVLDLSPEAKGELSDLLKERGFESQFCSAGIDGVREVTSGKVLTGYEVLLEGDLFIDVRGNSNMKGTHQYTLVNINVTEGNELEIDVFESKHSVVERNFALSRNAAKARENYNGFIPCIGATFIGGNATAHTLIYFSSPNLPWWLTTIAALAGAIGGAIGGFNYATRRINSLKAEKKETRSQAEQSLTQFQKEYEPHTFYDQFALRKALGV